MSKLILNANQANSLLEEMHAGLQKRFARAPRPVEPIVYEFTDDRALLHQYYRIREAMYRKIHHIDKFSGAEDVYDKISHILIARRGKLCIGGCRLIIREGDEDFSLPMETDGFKVREVFPSLPLTQLRHGEISRFAVLDNDDDHMDIMLALSQLVIEKCISADLGYIFIKSPGTLMARNWRKIITTHCGQKDVEICTDIKMPTDPSYPEIEWKMLKAVLPAAKIAAFVEEEHVISKESPIVVH